jgi:hypothetical protein
LGSIEQNLVVLLSGIVEIATLGLATTLEKTTSEFWMGLSHILPSFPEIAQLMEKMLLALNSDSSRLIRLFFQPVLIAWHFGRLVHGSHGETKSKQ